MMLLCRLDGDVLNTPIPGGDALTLTRCERLVILRRRKGWTWRRCCRELGPRFHESTVSEAMNPGWQRCRLSAATRERVLSALETLLEER